MTSKRGSSKRRRTKQPSNPFLKLLIALLVLVLLVLGVPFVVVQALAADRVYKDNSEVPAHDVAMVMGAATWFGQPSPYLQGRLDVALDLYHNNQVKVIIVSGSTSDDEPEVMRQYLVNNGVAYNDVVLDEGGNDSYASCAHAIDRFGVEKLIVVSQDYHLPRTIAACRLQGIDAIGAADTSRAEDATKASYERREIFANVKLILEAIFQRKPYQGEPTDEVRVALQQHE